MKVETIARTVSAAVIVKTADEYIVKAFDQHGERFSEADYYTTDKTDAQQTRAAMIQK